MKKLSEKNWKRTGIKRIGMVSLLLGALAALFICGCTVSAASGTISQTKAKKIALDKAKVKSSEVKKWTKVKLDNWDKDKDKEWDVEFRTGTYKFEVEINARTGKVEDFEKEKIKKSAPAVSPAPSKLTKAEAKKIALQKAKVKSSEVTKWTKTKLDGNEWEIEFRTASYKYEMEINARTGKVKGYEKEKIKKKQSSSSKKISVDKAKSIALEHARKNKNISGNVKYTKAKLDRDDGVELYEIEFRSKGWEFEYEINAANGRIISWDMDYDD